MSIERKKEIENIVLALGTHIHTVAHAEAYRQVTDVLTTVNAHAQRITALETTGEVLTKADLENHSRDTQKYLHNAVANMTTPHDEKVARLEAQVARLERQMSKVVALFEYMGQESQNLE